MTTLVATTVAPGGAPGRRVRVPWATVVVLALVTAYTDSFWTVAMRGAVGSIPRVEAPFASWLRESAVLLPLYVFAVLAALTLALRWFGPHPPRARARAVTLLLVVLTATVAGVAVLTANAVYDYQLQSHLLRTMPPMNGSCDAACMVVEQQATLSLQVRAVELGSLLVLVSNLVVVALVVGLRGGRLDVVSRRADGARPLGSRLGGRLSGRAGHHQGTRLHERLGYARLFVAGGLAGAAAVHVAVLPEHFAVWPAAGWFFLLLGAAQAVVGVLVLTRPQEAVVWAAVTVTEAPILLWLVSRTVGLPFGPGADAPEPIGLADSAAFVLEAAALAAAVMLLRGRDRPRPAGIASRHLSGLALVAVVAVTTLGVGGGLALFAGPGLPHAHPTSPADGGVSAPAGHHSR